MFKRIKRELFYIREIFRYKYSFISLINYLKNRFFGSFFLEDIKKFNCQMDNDFELHTLCQKRDTPMLTWSLSSFLHHSGLCPKIVVHDDGTLTGESAGFLKNKFSNLEVVFRAEADEIINNMPGLSEKLIEYRKLGHNLILKLVDIYLLSKSSVIMVLDSDVLFFNTPEEIINFIVNNENNYDSLISTHDGSYDLRVSDNYLASYDLVNKKASYMNSGIILFKKDKLTIDKLLEYFDNCLREPADYFVEMAGWGSIIAQTRYHLLPLDKYIIKGKTKTDTIAKHFTGPRRHEFYIYGIDMVKRGILEHE